jgi:hypothetical protein
MAHDANILFAGFVNDRFINFRDDGLMGQDSLLIHRNHVDVDERDDGRGLNQEG